MADPVRPAPNRAAADRSAPLSTGATARPEGGYILLAEDNPTNQLLMKAILRQAGFRVEIAESGATAVDLMRDADYGLVLMDVQMPSMDGFEAARRIRRLPPPRGQVPMVGMTAYGFADSRRACMAAGMNDFVTKPIHRKTLLAVVDRWYGRLPQTAPDVESMPENRDRAAPDAGWAESAAAIGDPVAPAGCLDAAVLGELERSVARPVLVRVVEVFLQDSESRLGRLESAAATGDRERLGREAHTLASAFGTFGATQAKEDAAAVEALCQSADAAEAVARVPSLVANCRRALITLRQWASVPPPDDARPRSDCRSD